MGGVRTVTSALATRLRDVTLATPAPSLKPLMEDTKVDRGEGCACQTEGEVVLVFVCVCGFKCVWVGKRGRVKARVCGRVCVCV